LHTLAESINVTLSGHIGVELELMIRSIPNALPCATCQVHARDYIKNHPPLCRGLTGNGLRGYVRRWFWEFHETVSKRKRGLLDIQASLFVFESLERIYSINGTMTHIVNIVDSYLRQGVGEGIIRESAYMVFRRHLDHVLISRI
jgi:hypothetical protein